MYETEIVSCDLSNTPDEAWWSFSPLTLLDLSSNALHGIPKEIKTFEDLSVLNVSTLLSFYSTKSKGVYWISKPTPTH